MWNTLSSVVDWLARLVEDDSENDTWYKYFTPSDVLVYRILLLVLAASFIYYVQYFPRMFYAQYQEANIDGKIEEIRRRYKALKTREAIFCNLNFGKDKKVKIGKFSSGTDVEKLREAIRMIQDAINKEMKFFSELSEHIKPFIKDLTGDGILPEDMELEDLLASLQLFAQYLEKKEPVRARKPQRGEVIYPLDLEERVEELKKKLKAVDDLIVLNPSRSSTTLTYVSRKGKVEEIKTALKDLELVMRKRSEESCATLLADAENMIGRSSIENFGTRANVPSSTYLADTQTSIDEDHEAHINVPCLAVPETLSEKNIDEDHGTHENNPCLAVPETLTETVIDEDHGIEENIPCLTVPETLSETVIDEDHGIEENIPCLTVPETLTETSVDEDHGTDENVTGLAVSQNVTDTNVGENCGSQGNVPCNICLVDPDSLPEANAPPCICLVNPDTLSGAGSD